MLHHVMIVIRFVAIKSQQSMVPVVMIESGRRYPIILSSVFFKLRKQRVARDRERSC